MAAAAADAAAPQESDEGEIDILEAVRRAADKKAEEDRLKREAAELQDLREEVLVIISELEEPHQGLRQLEPFQKVVKCMRALPEDQEVQFKGCFIMAFSAVTHFRYVFQSKGLEAVIAAMQEFKKHKRMQAEGCEMMRVLAWHTDGARRVLAAGGLDVALEALRSLPEDEIIPQDVCGIVAALAQFDAAAVLAREGVLEVVMRTMELSCGSWVQMWGCQALYCFAERDPERLDPVECRRLVTQAKKLRKSEGGLTAAWAVEQLFDKIWPRGPSAGTAAGGAQQQQPVSSLQCAPQTP